MASVKLSILIPSIPERLINLHGLITMYESQIEKYNLTGAVEVLSICDNKKRSIGRKRSDLMALAEGRYWVMTDDDSDYLTDKYFEKIGEVMELDRDVITYWQYARINNEHSFVEFGHNSPIQDFVNMGVTKRPAWHCCTWKRELVKNIQFGDCNYGEDHKFAMEANELAKSSAHISEICHVYQHDSHKTAAFL